MAKQWLIPLVFFLAAPTFAQPQIGGGTCSTPSLSGNYAVTVTARQVSSSGTFAGVSQSNGVANFDGQGHVSFAVTTNTNTSSGQPVSTSGPVAISTNCSGSMSFAGGTFNLVVYNDGKGFLFTGTDNTSTIMGTGTAEPPACLTSSLSGLYAFNANGFSLAGTSISGISDLTGLLQFDGQGKLIANWTVTSGTTMTKVAASGTYAVNTPSSCLGTATLADSGGKAYTFSLGITDQAGTNFQLLGSGPQMIFLGTGHSAFQNPSQSVTNGASFRSEQAPPGSIFSIFGENLGNATPLNAGVVPLPTTLGSTRVTINGNAAPLFFSGQGQINAQMPLDIAPGLAELVVTNGNVASNAVAVLIPQAAPGIFLYGNNRGVVINPNGSTNSETKPAHVGDTVVAYFTGGGPVTPSGPWTTGAASPDGESPVTAASSVMVSGKPAQVSYVGLSGGSVGLYQANFVVPKVVAGDHPLVIAVNGVKSNAATITIAK
jgi:uncharacterized protein (TIGR03437 family)